MPKDMTMRQHCRGFSAAGDVHVKEVTASGMPLPVLVPKALGPVSASGGSAQGECTPPSTTTSRCCMPGTACSGSLVSLITSLNGMTVASQRRFQALSARSRLSRAPPSWYSLYVEDLTQLDTVLGAFSCVQDQYTTALAVRHTDKKCSTSLAAAVARSVVDAL